jgi:hypothetical protein
MYLTNALKFIFVLFIIVFGVSAFTQFKPLGRPVGSTYVRTTRTTTSATFLKDTASDFEPDSGYGLIGTLSRRGPIPFFIRVLQPQRYEEQIEKFMKEEGLTRADAMANADAFFDDPIGWNLYQIEFKKSGYKPDYLNENQSEGQLALTLFWGTLSSFYIWRIYAYAVLHIDYRDNFWGF